MDTFSERWNFSLTKAKNQPWMQAIQATTKCKLWSGFLHIYIYHQHISRLKLWFLRLFVHYIPKRNPMLHNSRKSRVNIYDTFYKKYQSQSVKGEIAQSIFECFLYRLDGLKGTTCMLFQVSWWIKGDHSNLVFAEKLSKTLFSTCRWI